LAQSFPVVVVTSARQTGKTSLLRRLFADYTYVSLDIPSTAEMAGHNPAVDRLWKLPPEPVAND
jgi:hypothetical protein